MYVFTVTLQMTLASKSLLAVPTLELFLLLAFVFQVLVQAGLVFVNVTALRTTVSRVRDDKRGLLGPQFGRSEVHQVIVEELYCEREIQN